MRLTKPLAALAAGVLLAGTALVALAGPASASETGPELSGDIFFFNQAGGFDANTAANQVTSGTAAARPFQSSTTDAVCPAGTVNVQLYIRIPAAGVPVTDWAMIALTAQGDVKDAQGRFYTGRGDLMAKSDAIAYVSPLPGHTGTLPLIMVCQGAAGGEVYGYVESPLTLTATSESDLQWSIPTYELPGGGTTAVATATTLTAAVSGADLVLTAAVAPAAAGTVTFAEGGTTLGTAPVAAGSASFTVVAPAQGNHTYTASFAPTDTAAYEASQGTLALILALDAATGQLVLTVPAAPVVDGSLTFSVPFDTPVALAGSRDAANTRVVATGAFPTVTVTDTRSDALLTGWEVNAQATDFTGTAGTVGAKYLGWTPATPTMTPDAGSPLVAQAGPAVASYIDNDASGGLGTSSLLGRAATPGRGVSTLGAQLNLAIPAATSEGTYTSTVTVTLVSN